MSKIEITKPGLFVVVCDEVASAWTFETREDAAAFIADKDESTGGNFGFHLYDLRDITGSARSIADALAASREALQAAQVSARDWAASAGRLRETALRFKRDRDALMAALAEVRIEACEGLNAITDNAEFWAKAEMQRNAQALVVDVAKIIDAAILPLTCRAELDAAAVESEAPKATPQPVNPGDPCAICNGVLAAAFLAAMTPNQIAHIAVHAQSTVQRLQDRNDRAKAAEAEVERLKAALKVADEGMAEVHASPLIDGSDLPRILAHARGAVRRALGLEV